ncbi:hypothetical protein GCM10010350_59520 [Streptomyces galilaeus]|nr:hypothetical protein GCM10010350_59520 [Streptomyces galilaeus]
MPACPPTSSAGRAPGRYGYRNRIAPRPVPVGGGQSRTETESHHPALFPFRGPSRADGGRPVRPGLTEPTGANEGRPGLTGADGADRSRPGPTGSTGLTGADGADRG